MDGTSVRSTHGSKCLVQGIHIRIRSMKIHNNVGISSQCVVTLLVLAHYKCIYNICSYCYRKLRVVLSKTEHLEPQISSSGFW